MMRKHTEVQPKGHPPVQRGRAPTLHLTVSSTDIAGTSNSHHVSPDEVPRSHRMPYGAWHRLAQPPRQTRQLQHELRSYSFTINFDQIIRIKILSTSPAHTYGANCDKKISLKN